MQPSYRDAAPPPTEAPSGRATLALALGLLSWVCLLGFLTGVPAAILGKLEMNAIDEGRAPEAGRTRATIGMVSGLVATLASCLGCGVYITVIALSLGKA